MAISNIIKYITLFAVILLIDHVNSVPIENQWSVKAQNSIKNALSKIESYKVDDETIKMITNGAYETFKHFVDDGLSNIIDQVKKIKSDDEFIKLTTQIKKWLEALDHLNSFTDINDKTVGKVLRKFLSTIDYITKEIIGFDTNNYFESLESKQIIEKFKLLLHQSVAMLVDYAEYVEEQISVMSNIKE